MKRRQRRAPFQIPHFNLGVWVKFLFAPLQIPGSAAIALAEKIDSADSVCLPLGSVG